MNHLNTKSLICIEYPGIVKNVDRMLDTLGGLDKLISVCANTSLRLQLRFRPNDPFSHCAMADKLQLNNLLARSIKKKVHYSDGTTEIKFETVIVGLIEATYRFETLADFQYLPIERINFNAKETLDRIVTDGKSNVLNVDEQTNDLADDEAIDKRTNNDHQANDEMNENLRNESKQILGNLDGGRQSSYKSIFKQVYPYNALDGQVRKFDEDAPLFVMPIIFSRFDSPSDYFYKDDPKSRKPTESTLDESSRSVNESTISLNRKSRAKYVYLITFQDEPPKQRNVQQDDSVDQVLLKKIRKEFDDQPIWTKTELAYRNKCKKKELKQVLPIIAFYYTNGPFRGKLLDDVIVCFGSNCSHPNFFSTNNLCDTGQWVRFGYNPKENNQSRFHQTLDLRLSYVISRKYGVSERRKPAIYNSLKNYTSEKKTRENTIAHNKFAESSPATSSNRSNNCSKILGRSKRSLVDEVTEEDDFKFIAGRVPRNKQIFYQVKNIELDEVKEILEEQPKDICDEKDGWWPAGTIDRIRSLILSHVDRQLDADDTSINTNLIEDDKDEDDKDEYDKDEEVMEYESS